MRLAAIFCVTACLLACGRGGERWVLLPESAVEDDLSQCSRPGPAFEGTWSPGTRDLDKLELNLDRVALLAEPGTKPPAPVLTYRQYVGVIIKGTRLIYVNASPAPLNENDRYEWKSSPCDGGSQYLGALYDPAANRFSDLRRSSSWGSD